MSVFHAIISIAVVLSLAYPVYANEQRPLVIYAVVTDYAETLGHAFSKRYNIPVRVIPMFGSGDALVRLRHEAESPKADVWLGGSVFSHAQGAYQGLTQAFQPTTYGELLPRFRDPLGASRVTGLYVGVLGLVVNTDYLKANGVALPKSWHDLISPDYRGMIGMKSPVISGTAYTTIATLVSIMGENQAFCYLRELHKNNSGYQQGLTQRTISGQLGITITFLHEIIRLGSEKNTHIQLIIPEEGTGYEIGGISLVNNRHNTKSAQQFINFATSQFGQSLRHVSKNQLPTHRALHQRYIDMGFEQMPLIEIDFRKYGYERERLITRWRNEVQSNSVKAPSCESDH